jgi:hypothetical protein
MATERGWLLGTGNWGLPEDQRMLASFSGIWRLAGLIACAAVLSFFALALADEPSSGASAKPTKQMADGRVILNAQDAVVHGKRLRYQSQKDALGYWFNADDWISWQFEITKPGKLVVELLASCDADSAGSHYTVEVGQQRLRDKVQNTQSFRRFLARRAGTLEFDKPGTYTLSIHVLDKPAVAVMDLRAVVLTPPKNK